MPESDWKTPEMTAALQRMDILDADDFFFRVARSIDTLCLVSIITRDQRNRAIRWMVRNPEVFNYKSGRTVLDAASFAVMQGNPGWSGID